MLEKYKKIVKENNKIELPPTEKERIILSIGDLLKKEYREDNFIVNPMIVEEGINVITAKSGVGKSLLMLKMAQAIATGQPFLEKYETKKAKILIIDLEMSENLLIERAKYVVREDTEIDFYCNQSFTINENKDTDWLIEKIKKNGYKVVVIDTFNTAHTKNENDNSEMRIVNQELLKIINETGCTIIFLHHEPKGEDYKGSDIARGATEIIAKASSHISLKKTRGTSVMINGELIEGFHISVSQGKARERERLNKFGVETNA